jgi:hypothetical protein
MNDAAGPVLAWFCATVIHELECGLQPLSSRQRLGVCCLSEWQGVAVDEGYKDD